MYAPVTLKQGLYLDEVDDSQMLSKDKLPTFDAIRAMKGKGDRK